MGGLYHVLFWLLPTIQFQVSLAFNRTLYPILEAEQRLHRDLLKGYEAAVCPSQNMSDAVQVSFGVTIVNILELNERTEILDANILLLKSWHDVRLEWKREDYAGIEVTRLPISLIWKPDIIPYNNVDSSFDIMETMAVVYTSGHVTWSPSGRLKSRCNVDLTKFPFDKQRCSMNFGSWTYSDNKLNITFVGGSAKTAVELDSQMRENHWVVDDVRAVITKKAYTCCKETYPEVVISLTLKRNPVFYAHMFIIPAVLLGILVPFQFLLSPASKERITMDSVLIMSIMLLNLKLQDVIPGTSNTVPAVEMYYMLTLIWVVISMVSSMWVVNVYSSGPRCRKVPDTVRWIFLRSLKRLVCLGGESYYPLDETESISLRGIDKTSVGAPTPTEGSQRNQDTRCSSKVETTMVDILRQLHLLTARAAIDEARNDMLNEWYQVALVLDRVMFFFFILIFLMCTVILLG
ncbi:neuronal acetylcholine receptor subunit alpha-3-like [Gigantopelta aegis]|uniref:neuronal acetylcholine receptor subunit alpha-3-like n=1 Tax=Gigantopelta aegis TaxID=1735272 RepID=UPI001B8874D4|nr:neuronal acetylcholine receptor subunit alpha-3-like [Gigantopelta aegis]